METVIDPRILRMRREAKGWDQSTLARVAGVNSSVISRLERGLQMDLRASVLIALANALEVSVDALLPASIHITPADHVSDLGALFAEVQRLPSQYQRQIAAVLFGYLTTLPDPLEEP